MKIINIVPGFGGTFYCGNCLRDSAFTTVLRKEGHDAFMLPLYLPLTSAFSHTGEETPVFYGAVNIYLRQSLPFMRNMPSWMERIFNADAILKFAAKKSGSTRAHGLEKLTESMLLGEDGYQHHELEHLVGFLRSQKPDVVHFSNALLIGLAGRIRRELKIPVICSLQDEDVWVDAMAPEWQDRIWKLMSEKSGDVNAFVAVSRWFAGVMQTKMHIPQDKIHVIPIGIDPSRYTVQQPAVSPRAIGYLSRICEENGFGILTDAFILLKEDPRFSDLQIIATGGMTGDDKPFLKKQIRKLKKKNLAGDLHLLQDFTPQGLGEYFRSVTVQSVPVLKGEAFGLYQLEALASGIPIVQPATGAFPEIIHSTGGGLLYDPNTPEALAERLAALLSDHDLINSLGRTGRRSVEDDYHCKKLTAGMVEIYRKIISEGI